MLYTILKFVHVMGMSVWFGGLVAMLIINRTLAARGEHAAVQAIGRLGQHLGMRLFMPAMIVTLITGIGMVQVGELSFKLVWSIWGMIGVVVSVVVGGILTGGTARKMGQAAARGESDAAGIATAQRRILMFAAINLLVLLSVIYVMVAKPS